MRGLAAILALSLVAGAALAQATKTGKERLTGKWADEQRVDDCKVPEDKRDPSRKRPDCADAPQPAPSRPAGGSGGG